MATPYELLTNGSIFEANTQMFSAVMGSWWYIILIIGSIIAVYITTKSEGATAGSVLLGVAFMSYQISASVPIYIHGILYLIGAMLIAMLLYRGFGGKE